MWTEINEIMKGPCNKSYGEAAKVIVAVDVTSCEL